MKEYKYPSISLYDHFTYFWALAQNTLLLIITVGGSFRGAPIWWMLLSTSLLFSFNYFWYKIYLRETSLPHLSYKNNQLSIIEENSTTILNWTDIQSVESIAPSESDDLRPGLLIKNNEGRIWKVCQHINGYCDLYELIKRNKVKGSEKPVKLYKPLNIYGKYKDYSGPG